MRRDAGRASTCCSVMIQPLSLVALTQQDDIAAVTSPSSAAAALAGPTVFLVVAAS